MKLLMKVAKMRLNSIAMEANSMDDDSEIMRLMNESKSNLSNEEKTESVESIHTIQVGIHAFSRPYDSVAGVAAASPKQKSESKMIENQCQLK